MVTEFTLKYTDKNGKVYYKYFSDYNKYLKELKTLEE